MQARLPFDPAKGRKPGGLAMTSLKMKEVRTLRLHDLKERKYVTS